MESFEEGDRAYIYLSTNSGARRAQEVVILFVDEIKMSTGTYRRAMVKIASDNPVEFDESASFSVGYGALCTKEEVVMNAVRGVIELPVTRRYR
jgi:hypothetical protein